MEAHNCVASWRRLPVKVAVCIAAVIVVGNLLAAAGMMWSVESEYEKEFSESRVELARQVAATISGAVRWKKGDVVDTLVAPLIKSNAGAKAYVAMTADGAVLKRFPESGPLVTLLEGAAGADAAKTVRQGDWLVTSVPVSKSAKGDVYGKLIVAWDASKISAAAFGMFKQLSIYLAVCMLIAVFVIIALIDLVVTNPINALNKRISSLMQQDFAETIPHVARQDEIGVIARGIDEFRNWGLQQTQRETELKRVVDDIGSALTRLSERDLSAPIDRSFPAEFEKLRKDYNNCLDGLSTAIAKVASTSLDVKSSTSEIASASEDFSRRTEEQASSLQQVSQALEAINGKLNETVTGAQEASQVVAGAEEEADSTWNVVKKTIDAMDGIEKSSTEIYQIIAVIDEIAFQTNLLALNAGVEAARAGEAGRGFAVVAQEVRGLAQRSADAAKQIKELIENSTSQVKVGVKLVDDTGNALERIIKQVVEANAVVKGIVACAEQQAAGLQEVSGAMSQVDSATQSNASMIEESAAAARVLAQQTVELAELVQGFKVGKEMERALETRQSTSFFTGAGQPARKPVAKPSRPPVRNRQDDMALIASRKTAVRAAPAVVEAGDWEEF